MIDFLRSFIPWEKSLPANRCDIKFSLRIASGSLERSNVQQAIGENFDDLLSLETYDREGHPVDDAAGWFKALQLEKREFDDPNEEFRFQETWPTDTPSIRVTYGQETGYDTVDLYASVQYFDWHKAMNIAQNFPSENFHSAYLVDDQYQQLQNLRQIESYKYRGGLPTIDWGGGGGLQALITDRPGRSASFPGRHNGSLETGAAHYWFGNLLFPTISKEHIMAFDGAHKVEELPNGIVYVNLYEGTFNGNLPENQAKQDAFCDYLGLRQAK